MFDVITIGSATRDVFVRSKAFRVLDAPQFPTGKALGISLGSKVHVEELQFFIGGGAVDTVTTFARQGLLAGAFTVTGDDPGGHEIRRFFKKEGISLKLASIDSCGGNTSYSIILTAGKKDRSILRYDGAVWHFGEVPFPEKALSDTRWFYINHLGGEAAKLIPNIFKLAQKKGIKVAWNPGSTQIRSARTSIRPYLSLVDVFIVNQEEACLCTKIPYKNREKIFEKLDKWVKGIVIMTKGPKGVEVSDGKTLWSAGILPTKKMVDRTGAGDAFGSGFVASLIKKPNDIEYAIQLASANATGVLTKWGASNGLLKKGDSPTKYGTLKIKKLAL